jgi:ABC-type uncharacterized transport system ATPase subunit
MVEDYNIYLSDLNHPVNYMSGGNLQKLLIARELSQKPRVLVAAYPSRDLILQQQNPSIIFCCRKEIKEPAFFSSWKI